MKNSKTETRLLPGDRVAQSRSAVCFQPTGEGFPWRVETVYDEGRMVVVRYVGPSGKEDFGISCVSALYLVKAPN